MTRLVVDASVAAKWLAPEAESDAAEALLEADLNAPDLLYAEVANILWKKTARGEMTAHAADLGARWLLQVPMRVHDSAGLLLPTMALSRRLGHPAYDCFYLALAVQSGCRLVTADRRLHARCMRDDAAALGESVALLGA